MTNIRRYFKQDQLCFQTHVTFNRAPILVDHADLLWQAILSVQTGYSFDLIAWVILPDHFHLLVDSQGSAMSSVARQFKLQFSAAYRSRHELKEGRLWQNRFWDHIIRDEDDLSWDHIIRDEDDLRRHIEYIHYNPVKHGLAQGATEYSHSSFGEFAAQGLYDETWGARVDDFKGTEFGE
jgi:putative transposase